MRGATAEMKERRTGTKEWVGPILAARMLDVSRDTLLKFADQWGIRIRTFPREPHPYRQVNRLDVLRCLEKAEAGFKEKTAARH